MAQTVLLACVLAAPAADAGIVAPPQGSCPPYATAEEALDTAPPDVVPSEIRPGARVGLEGLEPLRGYLPPEVWSRRDLFFHEGMRLEIGECHRRYPAPAFFLEATRANSGRVSLDRDGNLIGYRGRGLPFPPEEIPDDPAEAGQRWAWNYRYRYMGAGFRGKFRLIEVNPRKGKGDPYEGSFAWVALRGVPELADSSRGSYDFAAAGDFTSPPIARGVAWRQLASEDADRDYRRSDDIFVWIPDQRKVRRAPPLSIDGIFVPSYTLGQTGSAAALALPGGGHAIPDLSLGTIEHRRIGFEGLLLRPNAYRFQLLRVQDVLAPINSNRFGYPLDGSRSYGPTGLSLATDRWELRRVAVLKGARRDEAGPVASVTLYVDLLTAQPLYLVSRRPNELIQEVGILMGRFSADDPLQPDWAGSGEGFGVILPVAASFFVAGGGSWLRESFELRADPPKDAELKDLTTTIRLERGH
jgi:hypothetical protein